MADINTRCINTLAWFINKSNIHGWKLRYEPSVNLCSFGVIYNESPGVWKFSQVLHDGEPVFGVTTNKYKYRRL